MFRKKTEYGKMCDNMRLYGIIFSWSYDFLYVKNRDEADINRYLTLMIRDNKIIAENNNRDNPYFKTL